MKARSMAKPQVLSEEQCPMMNDRIESFEGTDIVEISK